MDPAAFHKLTERERDCLRLVLSTDNQKEIARQLGIAPNTVYSHLKNAMRKLGVGNSARAAQMLHDFEREATPPQSWGDQPIALSDSADRPVEDTRSEFVVGGPHEAHEQASRPEPPELALRDLLRLPARRAPGGRNDLSIGRRLRESFQVMLLAVFAIGVMASGLYGLEHIAQLLTSHHLPR